MKMKAEVNKVLKTLRIDLYGWTYNKGPQRAVYFTPPSLLTEEEYAGIKLRHLAIPPGVQSGEDLAQSFDNMVLAALGEFDGNPTERLSASSRIFVGDDIARLLFVAGHQAGCDIECDVEANRMVVLGEFTYGIDGKNVYGYRLNTQLDVNLKETLEPKETSCRERGFLALYRRAQALGKTDAMRALEMLRAYRSSAWASMAKWVALPQDETDISFLGEIIYTDKDPVGELFRRLVPRKITSSAFEQMFGKLENRVLMPDEEQRTRIWRTLFTR